MRVRGVILVAAALLVAFAAAAGAKEPRKPPSDGGLHVSGGGVVGYVGGGSGSISGNVTGPGGGRSSGIEPAVDTKPTAIDGGVVSKTRLPAEGVQTTSASQAPDASGLALWVLAVLGAGAMIWLYRRRPVRS
jgi:hypothetical protein